MQLLQIDHPCLVFSDHFWAKNRLWRRVGACSREKSLLLKTGFPRSALRSNRSCECHRRRLQKNVYFIRLSFLDIELTSLYTGTRYYDSTYTSIFVVCWVTGRWYVLENCGVVYTVPTGVLLRFCSHTVI